MIHSSKRLGWVSMACLGAGVVGVLAFLFVRSQGHDTSSYFQNVALVRELQHLDVRWELDVVKSKIGLDANYDSLVDPLISLNQLQTELKGNALSQPHQSAAVLVRAEESFGQAIEEKTRLIERFKSHNAVLQNSLSFLPTAAKDLQGTLHIGKSQASMAQTALGENINAILLATLVYNQTPSNEMAAAIRAGLEKMATQQGSSVPVRDRLNIFRAHVRTVLREQVVVNDLLHEITAVPTEVRINEFDRILGGEQNDVEKSVQRDRQFLLILSAVLVVLLLYSAFRLIRSNAQVNRANAQLFQANAELEQRVDERTHKLLAANEKLQSHEAELNHALHEANAASEAKSAFLATMSHELRTPLNAIIGFTELMQSAIFGPLGHSKYVEYIGDVNKSGTHLLSLINDILDLSRLDAGKAQLVEEQFSLHQSITDICRSLQPLAHQGDLKLTANLPPNLPGLKADQRRVRQIVLNLVSNAIKFTPAGGTVTVSAAERDGGLMVEVCDTGIGMSKDDLPKALERFGQVDAYIARKSEGTGLGLPLAKQLVEIHDGSFDIRSEPDVGTTVTITFPRERTVARDTLHQAEIIPIRRSQVAAAS